MKRRNPMRRPNGVGAYHLYLGQLLKKAKLKGKPADERKKLFKSAQAKAVEMAKSKGFSEKMKAAAKSANAAVQAKKATRRTKRKEKHEHITYRTARRLAGGMAAYRAMKPAERKALRKTHFKRKVGASEQSKLAFRLSAQIAPKGSTKAQRNAAVREAWKLVKAGHTSLPSAEKPAKPRRSRRGTKAGESKQMALVANPRRKGGKKAHRKAHRKGARKMSMMRRLRNTGEGVLAAERSFYGNLVTVPGVLSVVGVGLAHGFVAPMVADYLAQMFPSRVDIPVVGSVGAANFAFTATGLVAGGALVGLGATVAKGQQGLFNKMAMLAVGGGALVDIIGFVMNRGSYGAIDADGNVYGAIDNEGTVYGDVVAYGGYEYAGVMEDGTPVSYGTVVGSEYADAMPADAEDSGPDFNVAEGQALVDGPAAWLKRFGKSPVRATGIRSMKSRHAGREGHRWAWMIKLVGMEKAQQIAALPPEQRLEVIAKLRKAALESLANSLNAQAVQTTAQVAPAQNLLPAPEQVGLDLTGAVGAAGGAYGATMYAGGGY